MRSDGAANRGSLNRRSVRGGPGVVAQATSITEMSATAQIFIGFSFSGRPVAKPRTLPVNRRRQAHKSVFAATGPVKLRIARRDAMSMPGFFLEGLARPNPAAYKCAKRRAG